MRGSAELALAALRDLAPDGHPTPQQVVDAARPAGSPLHGHFTWDDTEAARQHRLAEARKLIAAVTVVYINTHGREAIVPAFLSVRHRDGRERDYWPALTLAENPEMRARTLWQLQREAAALVRRMEGFKELADIVATLRRLTG